MKVTSVRVDLMDGIDIVSVETDLPTGFYPYNGRIVISIDVDTEEVGGSGGEKYVRVNFPEIYNTKNYLVKDYRSNV